MNFLINTITSWNEPPRARHQFATALAKNYPVTFLSANKTGFPKLEYQKINENLTIVIPSFPIDFRIRTRIALFNKLYQHWLFRKIKKKYNNYIIVNFDFTSHLIFKYFDKVIYYCNDDFTAMSKRYPSFIFNYHRKAESIIASKSKFCIATSEYLKNKLSVFNNKVFEIRLGGPDIREYSIEKKFVPYEPGKKIKVVLLGYIGTASSKILNAILENDQVELIFIGPVEDSKDLINSDRIQFKGILIGKKLYEEINNAHVCIIPYIFNSKIDRTPNKLWQYFAVGKPVVITDIASIKNWIFPDKFLYRSKNTEEFVNNIILSAKENTPELTVARINESFNNTWEKRVDDFMNIFREN